MNKHGLIVAGFMGLGGLGLAASPVLADDNDLFPVDQIPGELSASMTMATDYIYRGLSQTSQDPAIQGSIDYALDTGIAGIGWYAGIWSSNIDFDAADDASRMNAGALETDLYTGFSGEVLGAGWDVGFLQYVYPGSHENLQYDFWEVYGSLGYDFGYFALTGGLAYSPDFYGGTGDALYYTADVEVPVYKSLALIGHFGHSWIDGDGSQDQPWANGGNDYSDIKVGVGATILGLDWEVAYSDTFNYLPDGETDNLGDERVTASVTASF